MPDDNVTLNNVIANNDDLKKTLAELRRRESELKKTIAGIKKNEIRAFNTLEYYKESLESVRLLITNIRFHLKRNSSI